MSTEHYYITAESSYDEDDPNGYFEMEFFNDTTLPTRFHGGFVDAGFEGVYPMKHGELVLHLVKEMKQPRWSHQLVPNSNGVVYVIKNDKYDADTVISSNENAYDTNEIARIYMNKSRSDVGLVIRFYQVARVDRSRKLVGRYRVADVAYSKSEMQIGMSKPILSRAGLFYNHLMGEFGRVDLIPSVSNVYREHLDRHVPGVTFGHPVCQLDQLRRYTMREHQTLEGLAVTKATGNKWKYQYMHPAQYFVPGLPVMNEIKGEGYILSGQSFFYETNVASEQWYVTRLSEVLAIRGHTESEFLSMVDDLKSEFGKVDQSSAGAHTNEADHMEAIRITGHVLRMHTCSRPYVADHAWLRDSRYVTFDQETPALHLPGDCEDSAWVVYQMHMQLLLTPDTDWTNPLTRALRVCAAVIGVPCVISGTFVDVMSKDGAPAESGHMFPCGIPFDLFGKAIGGVDFSDEFREKFGFAMPTNHHISQVAVLDGMFRSAMFYSKPMPSDAKLRAYKTTKDWLVSIGEKWGWKWEKYSINEHACLGERPQGMAFRLFTGALDLMNKSYQDQKSKLEYISKSFMIKDVEYVPCRSFVVMSKLSETSDRVADEMAVSVDERSSILREAKLSSGPGCGIHMSLFAEKRDSFKLVGILPTTKEIAGLEREIRSAYDRPITQLGRYPPDHFPGSTNEASRAPARSLSLLVNTNVTIPKHSNERITLYVYGSVVDQDIEELKRRLGVSAHQAFPYAFGTAVVIPL